MTVYLQDRDFTLHLGDARTILAELPADSVDCVVTSPPYWGLRDYGTGTWDGGDPDCNHRVGNQVQDGKAPGAITTGVRPGVDVSTCLACGARRVDQQLGLEPTPDAYIANMVDVFRQVRRVLRPAGTLWLNIGDSYASGDRNGHGTRIGAKQGTNRASALGLDIVRPPQPAGLKPKDLVGIPWMLAFALRADGWYLRSEIIWAKPNPMPESVTDRPTKAHEQIFLLSRSPRYWYDQEAVREPADWQRWGDQTNPKYSDKPVPTGWARSDEDREQVLQRPERRAAGAWIAEKTKQELAALGANGRNSRTVWEIATEPYPDAHFATFPQELARRCILAGCPLEVCATCGKARERLIDIEQERLTGNKGRATQKPGANNWDGVQARTRKLVETLGWSDCGHSNYRPGTVLDPFIGSGTVAHVARHHGRHTIGIELNPAYAELCARRTQQQSLLADQTQLTLI